MKMRVRGYDTHQLKDPYKYWSKLLDTPPQRKQRCLVTYTYVSRIDEHTLQFYMQYSPDGDKHQLCRLADNNTWTIVLEPTRVLPSHSSRLKALMCVWITSDKRRFSMYENPSRARESWGKSWPYEKGMQVFRGKILHKSRYVDRKRVIEPTGALEVKRKLEKIRELAPVMIRLLEANNPDRTKASWYQRRQLKQDLFKEFDLDNVTALDAERVYLLGETCTSKKQQYQFQPGGAVFAPLETDEQFRRRCIVNGLRKLREHIYSKEGVYQYKPIKA